MPGIVVFNRRWSVGSDDFVVAAVFMAILHLIWVIILGVILGVVEFSGSEWCTTNLWWHVVGYVVILGVCVVLEVVIAAVSMRGSILDPKPRASMQYLLYVRLVVVFVELFWLILGIVWVSQKYAKCRGTAPMNAMIGIIVCNWAVLLSVLISICCTFDTAGRSWVKMKRYQASVKERENRAGHKRRSGSRRRNWRHRKAMRAYEQSWDRRCGILFCCVKEEHNRNSFTEIAKLFTEFFRELDVVPTDVVAGLVLLRQHQKLRRKFVVSQQSNDVYQFLSGVPITPQSRFLTLSCPDTMTDYLKVKHYMRYALAAYGWPMYMVMEPGSGLCRIMPQLRCCCCCTKQEELPEVVEDNCCECNFAALRKLGGLKRVDIIYTTYHVNIGETPFFVAVDHDQKTVVVSIRGTLSLQDILTDLKADCEQLPTEPPKEDWLGHKGMVQAAVYIKKKLKDEQLLSKAFGSDPDVGTPDYELVLIGHSLGAGTAAILAILLRQEYPSLHCYSYSPPGGLLSASCVEDTKSFITSVIVGKDFVPRIGLHQLEAMRNDLINVIKRSKDPKWKIIAGSVFCCQCAGSSDDLGSSTSQQEMYELMKQEKENRYFFHPSDSQIALTTHTPLFPPGRIIHIVRNHPNTPKPLCGKQEPVYQAIWADNQDFDEVLISPTMINDHMADNVMDALEKVMTNVSPAKPQRHLPPQQTKKRPQITLLTADTDMIVPQDSLALNAAPPQHIHPTFDEQDGAVVWDQTDVQRRPVPGRSRMVAPLATLVRQSYPPNVPLDPSETRPGTLAVGRDDMYGRAPLASPETLSDASSMDSMGSKRFSNGYQKLTTSIYKMAPIAQSPLRPTRSDGFCSFPEQPSPSEGLEKYFPASSPGDLAPLSRKPGLISNDLGGDHCIVEQAVTPTDDHPKQLSLATELSAIQTSLSKPEETAKDNSSMVNFFDMNSLCSAEGENSSIITQHFSNDLSTKPLCLEDNNNEDKIPVSCIDVLECDLDKGVSGINGPYKLVYENESFTCDDGSLEAFVPHSPDSVDVSPGALMYHPILGHYSPAGRGYPHGFYADTSTCVQMKPCDLANSILASDSDKNLVPTKDDGLSLQISADCDTSLSDSESSHRSDKNKTACPEHVDGRFTQLVPPEICIDLCDANPGSGESTEDLLPVNIVDDLDETSQTKYNLSQTFDVRVTSMSSTSSSSSSSSSDSEDYEHMSDTPIQILTNEAYL